MKQTTKVFAGLFLIAVVVGVSFLVRNQKRQSNSSLTALVANIGGANNRLSAQYFQILDWPYDLIPGTSPEITARGESNDPATLNIFLQYAQNSSFTNSSSIRIPSNFITKSGTTYSVSVPATNRLVSFAPEKTYYTRLGIGDLSGRVFSSTQKMITPTACTVEFFPNQIPYTNGGLRGGLQTIASFKVKNTCNEEVKFSSAEFAVYGLQNSNPDLTNLVSNIKVYTGSTLLSQPATSWARYDFKNTIIPALGEVSFTVKADVPANITQGDYLTTRIEIRGTTPGTSIPQAPSATFVNSRGFAPSVMLGSQTFWQLKY